MENGLLTLKEFARGCGVRTRRVLAWVASGSLEVAHRTEDASYFWLNDVAASRERHAITLDPATAVETWRLSLPTMNSLNERAISLGGVEPVEATEPPGTSFEADVADVSGVDVAAPPTVLVARHEAAVAMAGFRLSPIKGLARKDSVTIGPIMADRLDRDALPAEAIAMIPEPDPEHVLEPGNSVVLANAFAGDVPTWLWGPTGGGKTSSIEHMAGILNWPVWRVNMHADFLWDDFVGTTEVVTDPITGQAITRPVDGPLILAMLYGGILLIDEITATPAHLLMGLQAVLERRDGVPVRFVNTRTGDVVEAHPNFRVMVTDNTNGRGDLRGAHIGTNVMNTAFLNRFNQWVHQSYPPKDAWVKIIEKKGQVNAEVAAKIHLVAETVNKGSALLGATTITSNLVVSPRDTIAVAKLAVAFGNVAVAFNVSMVHGLEPSGPDYQFLKDCVRNTLGSL